MQFITTLIINYIKSRATAELLKTITSLLLAESVKRTELKTDDALLELYNAIEDGTDEDRKAAMSNVVDSLKIDSAELFKK